LVDKRLRKAAQNRRNLIAYYAIYGRVSQKTVLLDSQELRRKKKPLA